MAILNYLKNTTASIHYCLNGKTYRMFDRARFNSLVRITESESRQDLKAMQSATLWGVGKI